MLRAQIRVTDQLDVTKTYDLKGAAVIAFERKFGKSIQEFAENPFMEHIMFLAYECARRANHHDGLSFDEWVELDHSVDFEADNDPLPEAPTPTS